MPDEEPGAGEDALQLIAVDLVIDKDFAADPPRLGIDEALAISLCPCRRHGCSPPMSSCAAGLPHDMRGYPRPRRAARRRPQLLGSVRRSETLAAPTPAPGHGSAHRAQGARDARARRPRVPARRRAIDPSRRYRG